MVCRALYGDNRLVDNPDLITQDDTVVRLFWALRCVPAARMIELENKTAATFQKKRPRRDISKKIIKRPR